MVFVFALLIVSGWMLFVTFRRLSTQHAGTAWWVAFCIVIVFGVGIGYHLAFEFEYNVSRNLRVVSFPIPTCAFRFEHGRWVDYPSPNWFAYPAAFTNFRFHPHAATAETDAWYDDVTDADAEQDVRKT
jgi:hypothetical protein